MNSLQVANLTTKVKASNLEPAHGACARVVGDTTNKRVIYDPDWII